MTGKGMIESSVNSGAAERREAWMQSVARLVRIAMGDTGQCRRVADFLLAWHNAEENGGWDPTDLWNVDAAIAVDMLTAPFSAHGESIPWRPRFSKGNRQNMGTLEGEQTQLRPVQ